MAKRDLLELINVFYEYLGKKDQIFLSEFRDIPDEKKRISYPTNKRIYNIIKHIQDRPYIYIHKNGNKTILRLSSKPRDPQKRYIQIKDIIGPLQQKRDFLNNQVKKAEKGDYGLYIEQYKSLIDDTLENLMRLREREQIYMKKES